MNQEQKKDKQIKDELAKLKKAGIGGLARVHIKKALEAIYSDGYSAGYNQCMDFL